MQRTASLDPGTLDPGTHDAANSRLGIHRSIGRVALLGAALFATACAKSADSPLSGGAPTAFFFEDEPNDSSYAPQPIGPVYPPEQLVIQGDAGYYHFFHHDDSDAFALQAAQPARVRFALQCYGDGDLDLCLYDPFLDTVVAHWDDYGDEEGSFDIPGFNQDFQLIVVVYSGEAEYDLELRVDPLPFGAPIPVSFEVPESLRPEPAKLDSRGRVEQMLERHRNEAAARAELLETLTATTIHLNAQS